MKLQTFLLRGMLALGAGFSSGLVAPSAAGEAKTADYRLNSRDLLGFQMLKEPDLKTKQRVTAKGEIGLPLIGVVTVAGRTLREAEGDIRRLYIEQGFFINPQVTLSIEEYSERYVTVLGQVTSPNRVTLGVEVDSIGLVEAITRAGGLTRIAKTDSVQITRRTASGEERIVVNLEAYLSGRRTETSPEPRLQPGDAVFVPERAF